MKKLIALVFVLLAAGIVTATAAFASGANHGFGPGTGVCSYTREDCSGGHCARQEDRGANYTDQNGDGVCDYRPQGGQGQRRNRFFQ